MNADKIVRALRKTCESCNPTPCCEFEALGPAAADLIESLQAQLSASQRRERAAVEMVGKWPVTIGDTFCGAKIIGVDFLAETVTLKWRGK